MFCVVTLCFFLFNKRLCCLGDRLQRQQLFRQYADRLDVFGPGRLDAEPGRGNKLIRFFVVLEYAFGNLLILDRR